MRKGPMRETSTGNWDCSLNCMKTREGVGGTKESKNMAIVVVRVIVWYRRLRMNAYGTSMTKLKSSDVEIRLFVPVGTQEYS
jgi:hypothetical protein